MAAVQILDAQGRPIPERSRSVAMLAGGLPYDATDSPNPELAAWTPWLGTPDVELNPYRDRIVSRVRDLVRNDGWASGGVTRILDNTIGANFRPVSKPDYRALAQLSGNPAFDSTWADDFGRALDACWRAWANE
jgi:capsid protein